MAGNKIRVTPEQLEAQAKTVEGQIAKYIAIYKQIYTEKDTMQQTWKGEANQSYCQQLDGFRNDFEALEKLLNEYVQYLNKTAQQYKQTEQTLTSDAKSKLTVGK